MRVSLIAQSYDADYEQKLSIPLFLERVSAGFPSPALFPYRFLCQCAGLF